MGPHLHAGPGFRCVISGEITNEEHNRTEVIRPGECFWEAGDIVHVPQNKTDKPAVLLVFEVLPASLTGRSIMPASPEK